MSWILARSQLLGSGSSDMLVVLAWLSGMVLRRTSMLEPGNSLAVSVVHVGTGLPEVFR